MRPVHFLFTLFLLATISVQSQDWSPVVVDRIAHYNLNGASKIVQSIWVDSSSIDSGITTHHLNRVVKVFDHRYDRRFGNGFLESTQVAYRNSGQFIQKEIEVLNSRTWRFIGATNYLIDLDTNATFPFGTEDNLEATISNIRSDSVLGVLDSIITLQLSNGLEIQLSKHHGIVKFPASFDVRHYYTLVGFQEEEANPSLNYLMDWEEGDFIHSKSRRLGPDGLGSEFYLNIHINKRLVIDEKIYFDVYRESTRITGDFGNPQYLQTFREAGDTIIEAKALNDSILMSPGRELKMTTYSEYMRPFITFNGEGMNAGPVGGPLSAILNTMYYATPWSLAPGSPIYEDWPGDEDTLRLHNGGYYIFHDELLFKYFLPHCFECQVYWEITKSNIGENTINVPLKVESSEHGNSRKPFPNPTKSNLKLPLSWVGPHRIFDVSGKEYNVDLNRMENSLNVDYLSPGLYLLISGDQTFRFIKE